MLNSLISYIVGLSFCLYGRLSDIWSSTCCLSPCLCHELYGCIVGTGYGIRISPLPVSFIGFLGSEVPWVGLHSTSFSTLAVLGWFVLPGYATSEHCSCTFPSQIPCLSPPSGGTWLPGIMHQLTRTVESLFHVFPFHLWQGFPSNRPACIPSGHAATCCLHVSH